MKWIKQRMQKPFRKANHPISRSDFRWYTYRGLRSLPIRLLLSGSSKRKKENINQKMITFIQKWKNRGQIIERSTLAPPCQSLGCKIQHVMQFPMPFEVLIPWLSTLDLNLEAPWAFIHYSLMGLKTILLWRDRYSFAFKEYAVN